MAERVADKQSSSTPHHAGDPNSSTMAARGGEHADMAPATPSYPSPNAAQMGQGTMSYYANNSRHLTADELHLSAELSREASNAAAAANMNVGVGGDGNVGVGVNGMAGAHHHPHHHGGAGSSGGAGGAGAGDITRAAAAAAAAAGGGGGEHHGGQQHLLQFSPNQSVGVDPHNDLSYGESSARRKRSKVSRACDECRRKKVRCDATSESGVDTCSNCRRTNVTCEFSRVPMKRGPSKGYIKELADRINSLESQMHPGMPPQPDMPYQPMQDDGSRYHEFSPSAEGNLLTRKRTYSMSEGLPNAFMQSSFPPQSAGERPSSVGGWPVQTPTKDTAQTGQGENAPVADMYPTSPLLASGGAKANQPFWSQDETSAAQPDVVEELQAAVEIDDKVIDAYYTNIHPILPVMSNSRDHFRDHLQHCNRLVQETFLHALYAVTGASLLRAEKELQRIPTLDKAQDNLFASFREEAFTRSLSTNLVILQSIIFFILDADSRGPENLRGQNGISKSVLLDVAFPLAYHVAKSLGQLKTSNLDDHDLDSDGNLARRNWIVVGILSRWHSVAVAGPDLFGNNETATAEDRHAFGAVTLQLSRYSTLLSEINDLLFDTTPYTLSNHGSSRALKRTLHGQLNRIQDVEQQKLDNSSVATDPTTLSFLENISPLIFWSITLLLKRHLFTYSPAEILYPAEVILDIYQKQTTDSLPTPSQSSPFHHHALALSIITLLELTDIPEYARDAWEALEKALQVLGQRDKYASTAGEFEKIFATQSWIACFRGFIEAKLNDFRAGGGQQAGQGQGQGQAGAPPLVGPTEQRSLQHLADLAVGAGGGAGNAASPPPEERDAGEGQGQGQVQQGRTYVDFTRLTRKGYLNVFAGI